MDITARATCIIYVYTPDTGWTITFLNLDVALRNGIHIDRTMKVELYHAAGGSMHIEGMANIRVCANKIQATLQVAVSSKLKEAMLISCDDLRKLRVIPADFPKNNQLSALSRSSYTNSTKCSAIN